MGDGSRTRGWRTNHRPSWAQLCQKERKWAEASGGHRAAVYGVDGARGVVEDHPGQHVLPAWHPISVSVTQQVPALKSISSLGTVREISPATLPVSPALPHCARGPRLEQRVKDDLVCTV